MSENEIVLEPLSKPRLVFGNSDLKTLNSNLSNTESEITKNTTLMNEANRLKRSYASTADDYYRRYRNGEDDPPLAT